MSEWQPIETAPKTTQSCLVWCPQRENIYVVSWWGDVWVHFGCGGGLSAALIETPTHWMPMPDPPKTDAPVTRPITTIIFSQG